MPSSVFSKSPASAASVAPELSAPLLLLFAIGAGLSAASLYYSQPLLGTLTQALHASPETVGLLPTLTQLGYAGGILLLAPLGDRHNRRGIILTKCVALCLASLACAFAPGMEWLLPASLVLGVAATVAQDIVPAVAALAQPAARGRSVGVVMTGLLLGILLSRVASGLLAEAAGWRSVYLLAGGVVLLLALAFAQALPQFECTTTMKYSELLRSLVGLWKKYPDLRNAVYAQALLAVAFSAFWSTLAVMLHSRYQLGSAVAGAFGLAGAAGALAAPLAGRFADRWGAQTVARWGALSTAVSFAAMGLGSVVPSSMHLPILVLTTVTFDCGVQTTLIGHQTLIYGLEPPARSRINAILLTGMFLGMAGGSALGSAALANMGWGGVVALATVTAALAWLLRR